MTPQELKEIRKSLGLSQSKLANLLGISEDRTVRRWESGESVITGPVRFAMTALKRGYRPNNEFIPGDQVINGLGEIGVVKGFYGEGMYPVRVKYPLYTERYTRYGQYNALYGICEYDIKHHEEESDA